MPAIAHFYFGLFFGESCEGAVVYGPEYGENLGVWDKDDFSGKIITLLRGATPTSSTSSQRQFAHPPLDGVVAQALAIESGKVVTTFDCKDFGI